MKASLGEAACFVCLTLSVGTARGGDLVLAAPRVLATATETLAGRILVAGGLEDAARAASIRGDAEIIDPYARDGLGRIVASKPLSGRMLPGRAGHAAVALTDGRVLLVGGDMAGSVELFDTSIGASGAFRRIGALPGGPRLSLTATLLESGEVLVTGGLSAARRATASASIVDVDAGLVTRVEALLVPRASHTATRLEDGRVLVVGGVGCASTELFDPETRRFESGPKLRHVRDDHRATLLLDGSVLVTGGQDARGRSRKTAERYDPRRGRFAATGDMAAARADHAQVRLDDGRLLVMGGERDDGEGHDEVLDSVEVFEGGLDRFVPLVPLETPRDDHTAVALRDGRVVVIGGQTTADRALRSIEIYRPRRK